MGFIVVLLFQLRLVYLNTSAFLVQLKYDVLKGHFIGVLTQSEVEPV